MAERLTRGMLTHTDTAMPTRGSWYRRLHDPGFWISTCIMEVPFQVVYWTHIFPWWGPR